MMKILCRAAALVLTLFASACGPNIILQRTGYAPPKADTCNVVVVTKSSTELMGEVQAPSSKFTMLGTITLSDSGSRDPFSEDSMEIVRPRVCKLGGDAVGLSGAVSVGGGGSTTTHAVFARKGGDTPVSTPPTM